MCLLIPIVFLGPVFVEFPIDSLYPYSLVKREIASSGGPGMMMIKYFVVLVALQCCWPLFVLSFVRVILRKAFFTDIFFFSGLSFWHYFIFNAYAKFHAPALLLY